MSLSGEAGEILWAVTMRVATVALVAGAAIGFIFAAAYVARLAWEMAGG